MNNEFKELLKKLAEDIINSEDVDGSSIMLQTRGNQFMVSSSVKYKNESKTSDYGLTAVYNKDTKLLSTLFETEN